MSADDTTAGWLERHYERAPGKRVAFVDEAYRGHERKGETPFYIAAAVVVDVRYMQEIRENLTEIAGGTYWHTTEAMRTDDGPAKVVKMLDYLAEGSDEVCMMSVQREISKSDRDLETARKECLAGLARSLASGQPDASKCMVIEKRHEEAERRLDSQLLAELIRDGHVPRGFQIHQASPREDRLLWLPDLVAYAARKEIALNQPYLFDQLRAFVHEVAPVAYSTPPVTTEQAPDRRSQARLIGDATVPPNKRIKATQTPQTRQTPESAALNTPEADREYDL